MTQFRWIFLFLTRAIRRIKGCIEWPNSIVLMVLTVLIGVVGIPWSHDGVGDRFSSKGLAQSRLEPILAITWQQTAQPYLEHHLDQAFYCPGNGQLKSIWGSDVYRIDSSICSAAVHAGLITVENGGAIAIRLLPNQGPYPSTYQNGVTSALGGRSTGSFTFTSLHDPIAGVVIVNGQSVPIQVSTWDATAEVYQMRQGDAIALYCPPKGKLAIVWGTHQYRDTSSICTAAVHSNRIRPTIGGAIAIEMLPGQTYYQGSTHHEVTSQSFEQPFRSVNSRNSSFTFVPFEYFSDS